MKTFDKANYNVKRLKPKAEDIELNKCRHMINSADDDKCILCGTDIDIELSSNELIYAADTLVDYLESMKLIANYFLSNKENRAAQKYFNMIPLLKNITELYIICSEEVNNALSSEDDSDDDTEMYGMSDNDAYMLNLLRSKKEKEGGEYDE